MRLLRFFVVLALIAGVLSIRSAAQTVPNSRFVRSEILVTFKPGVNGSARADAHRAGRGTPGNEILRTRVQRVRVPIGDELSAIARYQRNPNVLFAEPNFIRTIPILTAENGGPQFLPEDSHFAEQWALHNTGQPFYCIVPIFCLYQGTPDADIDAPEAWAISAGSSAVKVAVIDSGIDYTHPDLASNYIGGDDFISFDGDPMDDHGHGTHVAGTIAAAMNNLTGTPGVEEGVVGAAPNAKILAYKVCRSDGTCDDFAIQQAIARAITDGASVINMSLGDSAYSQSLDNAVQDAWNAGLVVVAGAGNDGTTSPFYPAALEHVISVAAFDEDHNRVFFSNYGSWVDISAPGNAILSTYPSASCTTSTTPGDVGCYTWLSGTSMATPHVSAAAALVWSRSGVTSNAQVVDILLNSADRVGVSSQRLDGWTIHGGLNLRNALTYSSTGPIADAGPDQTVSDANRDGVEIVTLDGTASSDPNGTIASYVWREDSMTVATGATAPVSLAVGNHTLTLEVTDNDGEMATDTVAVTVNASNLVTVTASSPQATEAGPVNGVFTVSRTGNNSAPLTVHYTVGGTATAGDYQSLSGAVTIEAFASAATITVTPVDDIAYESSESVVLTITADATYSPGSPSDATVTIVSDDLPPDLIVTSASAPAIAGADADIVVADTTRNQGTGSSIASATGFYLSTNAVLDAADVRIGSRPVPVLAPGATDVLSTTVHVPPSTATGTYYVLAKADWDNAVEESSNTNNVKSTASVRIGPDLIVSVLTAPGVAEAGSPINVSDTNRNQGGGKADPFTTRFYLSTNPSLDASDVMLGNRSVPSLDSGATDAATTPLTLPSDTAAGTYYVIAQADAGNAIPETTETNNTRASSALKIGPDLIVTAVSAPSSTAAGAAITVNHTTKNQGSGSAAASSTGFYLSADTTISATDTFLGIVGVGELEPGDTATASVSLQIAADTPPGTYYVIGKTDWNGVVVETTETNNERASASMRIGGDLVLVTVSVPGMASADALVTIADTTKNQGTGPVPESATGFYLSSNAVLDSTDTFLGSRSVGALAPSESAAGSIQVLIPADTAPGTYYVIGVADVNKVVAENLETNNTRVSSSTWIGPDLIVTAATGPGSAVAGTSIAIGDTTKNQAGDTAAGSVTSFYLSSNSTLDASDVFLGTRPVPSLAPGLSSTGSATVVIPATTSAGTQYIIARADGGGAVAEVSETNNTRARSISITKAP